MRTMNHIPRGADALLRETLASIQHFSETMLATLREIFDESAYDRFLIRRGLDTSRQAYAAFRQEQECAKARRPRCC